MMVFERDVSAQMVVTVAAILISSSILFSQSPTFVSASCINWKSLPDNDCDGLADAWETGPNPGYDVNNDGTKDLPLPGANPDRKDIFVEIDYMKQSGSTVINHIPGSGVVQAVVDAFAAAPVPNPNGQPPGIVVHVDLMEAIPHVDSITMWSGFDTLKNTWFGKDSTERSNPLAMQAKDDTYHYILFVHKYNGGTSSGLAEIPGDDLVVSLGASIWGKNTGGHNVGSLDQQKGTLMHELGHNLNLRHGGNVDENCKSNYISVMNYMFQFSNYVSDRRLDYSHSILDPLNENSLDESRGVSPASDPSGQKSNWGVSGSPAGPTPPLSLPLNPIDWNKNGFIDSSAVSGNINYLGTASGCTSTTPTPLSGFNDWGNLQFWGVTGGWGDGNSTSNGAGAGSGAIENASVMSGSMDPTNEVSMINATTIGGTIDVTALGNRTIGIYSDNQGDGLNITKPIGGREGLDEYNAENLVSSRIYSLESIKKEVHSVPDIDFKNNNSKLLLLNNLKTIGDAFNSNSTDLLPSITGLSEIRNQTNSSVINPNTQKMLLSQIDNFVEALKKQQ